MTESRCHDLICCFVIGQFNLIEVFQHLFSGNISSQKCIDLFRFKCHTDRFFFLAVYIYHTAYYFACTKLFDQLAGTVNRCLRIVWIQSLFKLTRCIGTKSHSLRRKTDIGSIEAGCFKHHRLYIICDHGVLSTHDTCNTNRFFTITDHQDILIHGTFLTIQCDKFFIFSGSSYYDLMTCDRIIVISMHRLAIFFHDIIGNIYDIINRTDTTGCQSSLQPYR